MRADEDSELNRSLGFNLDRVAKLYRRELIRALAGYGLSPEQWQVISALSTHTDGLSQAEIAALTSKDKHSMSRMLGRLERAGWVARAENPDDTRSSRTTLARPAADVDSLRAALRSHFAKINSALSEPQQQQLLTLLKTLRSHLEDG